MTSPFFPWLDLKVKYIWDTDMTDNIIAPANMKLRAAYTIVLHMYDIVTDEINANGSTAHLPIEIRILESNSPGNISNGTWVPNERAKT